MKRNRILIGLIASLMVGAPVAAKQMPQTDAGFIANLAPVPFGPGERMGYKISLGILGNVGTGSMEVLDLDTVQQQPSYNLRMQISGKAWFATVNDVYQSWLGAVDLVSRRFSQNIHEYKYKSVRTYDIDPGQGTWYQREKQRTDTLPTREPLDDLSFMYFARTLPLEVGKTYTFNRYFKKDGNPVILKVLRREKVETAAGVFNTIVVQPIIQTDGLFGEGGKAEVYFTDDAQRIPVKIKTKVKIIGNMVMELVTYSPGERLGPAFRPAPTS